RAEVMDWNDLAIVLSSRPHSETGLVASLLTRAHGRHAGFIHGGVSRKTRPVWQTGNVVEVAWRARLAEQLGNYTGELREPPAAKAMDSAAELAGPAAAQRRVLKGVWRRPPMCRPVRAPAPSWTRRCPSGSRIRRSTKASTPSC